MGARRGFDGRCAAVLLTMGTHFAHLGAARAWTLSGAVAVGFEE